VVYDPRAKNRVIFPNDFYVKTKALYCKFNGRYQTSFRQEIGFENS
jgi:hypothetical protein